MRLTKRRFLTASAATLLAGGGSFARGEEASDTPLTLTARRTALHLPGAGATREGLSFDGTAAGPVLRRPYGAALDLRVVNALDVPFVLQWHGLRVPNAVDGDWPLAGERILPGATQAIRFVPPDSGLGWFHPAPMPGQPDLTSQGLRGALIVDEAAPPSVDRDILLTLADWRLGDGGPALLTVNGDAAPARTVVVPGARLRLRVINASTLRPMILGLEGARPLIAAIDGQPSDLFEPVRDQVPVGPGARFEFMIDMPTGPAATLRLSLRGSGPDAGTVLFEARTDGVLREARPPIAPLPRNRALSPAIPLELSARADLRIEAVAQAAAGAARWMLNGRANLDLAERPLLSVRRGGSVTFGFDNRSDALVALRLHGHVMRLLHAKDDGWEPYWRDSIILLPGAVAHVAFVADNPGRWLLESALFDQAAYGLRHWFEVT